MKTWLKVMVDTSLPFFILVAMGCVVFSLFNLSSLFYPKWHLFHFVRIGSEYLFPYLLTGSVLWFCFSVIDALSLQVIHRTSIRAKLLEVILPVIQKSLKFAVSLFVISLFLPLFKLPEEYFLLAKRGLSLTIIVCVAWILLNIISILTEYWTQRYKNSLESDLIPRAAYTKIYILKKIATFVIIIVSGSIALMTFDSVKELGVSLLASAGLVSVILGFAAQKTLGTFFSGLQIAITQPIRIGDTVMLENEVGNVEEITLSYVVVKLWDQRRMVTPINYFLDKPFQNWTRGSTELLGTVFLYVDYLTPFENLRKELKHILSNSKWWDGRTANLEVTDCKQQTLELRILVSSTDASKLWNLRCEVREGLVHYISEHFPEYLPKMRLVSQTDTNIH